jgi:tetratricopeptide (TPR) repeat protein
MRVTLSTLLAATVAVSGISVVSPVRTAGDAPAVDKDKTTPEELYEQGRKAYRLGDFKTSVDKWQEAYSASDNALLLYNISLAYKGLYGITKDLEDLRKARAVLDNFIKLAEADPEVDIDDAYERLEEIDGMLEAAEAAEAARKPPPPTPPPEDDSDALRTVPSGSDPGRELRIAGIGTMAAGGALLLTAGGLVGYFAIRGEGFSNDLRADLETHEAMGCQDMPDGSRSAECQQLDANIGQWRANGRKANRNAIISGAVAGGLGLVGLVAGAVLFTEGNRRSRKWEKGIASRLRLMPARRGLVLSGRF